MRDGGIARRKSWDDKNAHIFKERPRLRFFDVGPFGEIPSVRLYETNENNPERFLPSDEDAAAEDWELKEDRWWKYWSPCRKQKPQPTLEHRP